MAKNIKKATEEVAEVLDNAAIEEAMADEPAVEVETAKPDLTEAMVEVLAAFTEQSKTMAKQSKKMEEKNKTENQAMLEQTRSIQEEMSFTEKAINKHFAACKKVPRYYPGEYRVYFGTITGADYIPMSINGVQYYIPFEKNIMIPEIIANEIDRLVKFKKNPGHYSREVTKGIEKNINVIEDNGSVINKLDKDKMTSQQLTSLGVVGITLEED